MEVTVNGRDADQEELESSDWVTKVSKRVAELQESQQRECDGATRAASTSSGCGKEGRTMPAGFNADKHGVSGRPSYKAAGKKLAERSVASHLLRLSNADHKVIIRPKEGLTLTRHSAPVIGGAEKPGVSHKASHDGGDCDQEKSKSTGPQEDRAGEVFVPEKGTSLLGLDAIQALQLVMIGSEMYSKQEVMCLASCVLMTEFAGRLYRFIDGVCPLKASQPFAT
ncbi:hypothetical protein MRX96_041249 [Rhipicephalus microplus]